MLGRLAPGDCVLWMDGSAVLLEGNESLLAISTGAERVSRAAGANGNTVGRGPGLMLHSFRRPVDCGQAAGPGQVGTKMEKTLDCRDRAGGSAQPGTRCPSRPLSCVSGPSPAVTHARPLAFLPAPVSLPLLAVAIPHKDDGTMSSAFAHLSSSPPGWFWQSKADYPSLPLGQAQELPSRTRSLWPPCARAFALLSSPVLFLCPSLISVPCWPFHLCHIPDPLAQAGTLVFSVTLPVPGLCPHREFVSVHVSMLVSSFSPKLQPHQGRGTVAVKLTSEHPGPRTAPRGCSVNSCQKSAGEAWSGQRGQGRGCGYSHG